MNIAILSDRTRQGKRKEARKLIGRVLKVDAGHARVVDLLNMVKQEEEKSFS